VDALYPQIALSVHVVALIVVIIVHNALPSVSIVPIDIVVIQVILGSSLLFAGSAWERLVPRSVGIGFLVLLGDRVARIDPLGVYINRQRKVWRK
jgi:hypothetical protein